MDYNIRIIYMELEGRYVKICWTHKAQEIQAGLYLKKSNHQKWWMAIANSLTSTVAFSTVVANGFKLVGAEWIWPAITSVLAVISSIITLRFKDGVLEDKALFCKQYAAKCRNIRNMYEAILADAKAGRYTIDQLCSKRDELAELEDALFSGEIAPHTTPKAIELAKESLIQNKDTLTEEHEIKAIVPTHLQEL